MSETDDGKNGVPPYVPDFVYLDMDQVKSISARMGGGFIREMVEGDEEIEQVSKSVTARLMASVFGIGDAGVERGRSQKRAAIPHTKSQLRDFTTTILAYYKTDSKMQKESGFTT
jgi:hypothetical protein